MISRTALESEKRGRLKKKKKRKKRRRKTKEFREVVTIAARCVNERRVRFTRSPIKARRYNAKNVEIARIYRSNYIISRREFHLHINLASSRGNTRSVCNRACICSESSFSYDISFFFFFEIQVARGMPEIATRHFARRIYFADAGTGRRRAADRAD